eukprot:4080776-Amphidinium_carterae.1
MLGGSLNHSLPGSAWAGVLSQGPDGEGLLSSCCEARPFRVGQGLQSWVQSALRIPKQSELELHSCPFSSRVAGQPGTQKCRVCPCRGMSL